MKLLKPEVDALKLKHTDKSGTMDQQAFSMEQMKLWKTAGVSPPWRLFAGIAADTDIYVALLFLSK